LSLAGAGKDRSMAYYRAMLDRGVLLPPSPSAWMCVSAAHTHEQIDQTIEAARDTLRAIFSKTYSRSGDPNTTA
jgi:glutamate-1-semialdehyde aminotransferase